MSDAGPINPALMGETARILAEQSAALHEVATRLRIALVATRWRSSAALLARSEAEQELDRLLRCAARYDEAARWWSLATAAVTAGP